MYSAVFFPSIYLLEWSRTHFLALNCVIFIHRLTVLNARIECSMRLEHQMEWNNTYENLNWSRLYFCLHQSESIERCHWMDLVNVKLMLQSNNVTSITDVNQCEKCNQAHSNYRARVSRARNYTTWNDPGQALSRVSLSLSLSPFSSLSFGLCTCVCVCVLVVFVVSNIFMIQKQLWQTIHLFCVIDEWTVEVLFENCHLVFLNRISNDIN